MDINMKKDFDRIKLPQFKYHPNVYENGIIIFENSICQCCGKETDVFTDSMYCIEDIACICMDCVASGAAAKKFDGEFIQDAQRIDEKEKTEELFCKTPGYLSWQGEYWLSCCQDYCAFLGEVGTKELEELGVADEVFAEYEAKDEYRDARKYLVKGGSLNGYLFQCLHCKKYHLWVDAD